mgnify:CR=1 FL=1
MQALAPKGGESAVHKERVTMPRNCNCIFDDDVCRVCGLQAIDDRAWLSRDNERLKAELAAATAQLDLLLRRDENGRIHLPPRQTAT